MVTASTSALRDEGHQVRDLRARHPGVQRRGKNADPCKRVDTSKGPTLPHLWHDHHLGRLSYARRRKAQGTICGFVP